MASHSPSPAQLQREGSETQKLVEKAIADHQVVIFSKSWCPHCKRVKSLFEREFPLVEPTILELDEHEQGPDIQDYLADKTGQLTVPSVFINQDHIGGNDATHAAFKSGRLKKLLMSPTPQA